MKLSNEALRIVNRCLRAELQKDKLIRYGLQKRLRGFDPAAVLEEDSDREIGRQGQGEKVETEQEGMLRWLGQGWRSCGGEGGDDGDGDGEGAADKSGSGESSGDGVSGGSGEGGGVGGEAGEGKKVSDCA